MQRHSIRGVALALVASALVMTSAAGAVVLQGRGELHALGSGLAVFDMRGALTVRGGGVLIVDEDAHVQIEGFGRETVLGDGRILYEGFGRATIASAERTRIEIAGANLRLHARGVGRAFLKGCGIVKTDDLDAVWRDQPEMDFDMGG